MNKVDFDVLIDNGNIGYYQSCEVTQFFISDKKNKSTLNFFIIASFEEKPFVARNQNFLTSKKGIKIDDNYNLGIQRYHLSINESKEVFTTLNNNNKWNYEGDQSLIVGKLKGLTKQYIPSREGQRINHVLKNNFHNGSYTLEFFDELKDQIDFLLDMKKLKKLNELSEKIKELVPIDMSIVRDRIGNIIFQFPITVLKTRSIALSSWDGVELKFDWNNKVSTIPDCFIQVDSTIDKNYMGGAMVDYDKSSSQQVIIGNLDQINHIKVWRKSPNLLLSTFDGTYIREFSLNMGVVSHEPRIFKIKNKEHHVDISSRENNSKKNGPSYTSYITNTLYEAEKSSLEKTLSFKQYFNGKSTIAIDDIRQLIKTNDTNGVCLWDPYLRAEDILKTIFFSPTNNTPLKAIGSIDSSTKKVYENKGISEVQIIDDERKILNNKTHNNYGLNLEFRIQHTNFGWPFHDRFLIFPGAKLSRPKVYSLGTSINSLGKSHHILQEVSHPQRVIDAFNELWDELNTNDCLVWKYPKK